MPGDSRVPLAIPPFAQSRITELESENRRLTEDATAREEALYREVTRLREGLDARIKVWGEAAADYKRKAAKGGHTSRLVNSACEVVADTLRDSLRDLRDGQDLGRRLNEEERLES